MLSSHIVSCLMPISVIFGVRTIIILQLQKLPIQLMSEVTQSHVQCIQRGS